MRGLLIVLCALATVAGVLAGGCAVLVSGLGIAVAPNQAAANDLLMRLGIAVAPNQPAAADLLMITLPVLAVTAAVVVANMALINALSRGRAPRRNGWFLLLAIVDFAVAAYLVVVRVVWPGPVATSTLERLLLPAALALKGALTLLLPAEPPHPPPAGPGRE